jgi:uncharacterized LabA/DUF88 family protein
MRQPDTKTRIIKYQLIWILDDCFTEVEIASLATRCGIRCDCEQRRISKDWLVEDLANAFFEQTLTEQAINRSLVQKARQAIRRVGYMSVEEIQTFLNNPTYLVEDGEFGEMVWALLMDSRETVQKYGQKLLKAHDRAPPELDAEDESHVALEEEAEVAAVNVSPPEVEKTPAVFTQAEVDSIPTPPTPDREPYTPLQELMPSPQAVLEQMRQQILKKNERGKQLESVIDEFGKKYTVVENENSKLKEYLQHLEKDNQILEEKNHQYIADRAFLHQLESENRNLKEQLDRTSIQLAQLRHIKAEKASLCVELKAMEEAMYREQQTLEKLQSEFHTQISQLRRFNEASQMALAQTQQKLTNLAYQRNVDIGQKGNMLHEQPSVGVFVDVQNMFYAAKDRYAGRVDYIKLLDLIVGPRRLVVAYAYVVQIPEINQSGFLSLLEHNGYTIKSKDLRLRGDGTAKGDWDVGIAIDIVSILDALDVVILASGDGDFCALAELIKRQGKRVEVVAFEHNTSMDLQRIADQFFPIGDDLLI